MKLVSLLRLFAFVALAAFASVGNTAIAAPRLSIEEPAGSPKRGGIVTAWDHTMTQLAVPDGLTDVRAIAAGHSHNVAAKSDGTVVAWGFNNYVPATLAGVTSVGAGFNFSVALKADGTVVAWGNSIATHVPEGLAGVVAISAGFEHVLALKGDGTVVAWGNTDASTVPPGLTGVTAIAANGYHSLALKGDGTVVAWGRSFEGQTTLPPGLTGVTAIAAGAYHSVALKSNGAVVGWGLNSFGQTTEPYGLSGVKALAAGSNHTVALKSDGTIASWGNIGGTPSLAGVTTIAVYGDTMLALSKAPVSTFSSQVTFTSAPLTFTIRNTGNENLTLGTITKGGPNSSDFTVSTPAAAIIVPGGTTTFSITFTPGGLGARSALIQIPSNDGTGPFELVLLGTGLKSNNANLSNLTLSVGTLSPAFASETTSYTATVPKGTRSITVTPSRAEANATIRVNGTTVTSGSASGNIPLVAGENKIAITLIAQDFTIKTYNVTVMASSPYLVVEQPSGISKKPRSIIGWGFGDTAQLSVPSTLIDVAAIAAGRDHVLALKRDGTVVAWGEAWANSNDTGQVSVPLDLVDVTAIAAGYTHSVALRRDGTVVVWGDKNGYYGLRSVPTGLTGVKAIAAGEYHTAALKDDGSVVAWGSNPLGQTTVPPGLTGVTAISAGKSHTVALKGDGTVVAWGDNTKGQTSVPSGLSQVKAIVAGGDHTVALKSDGTVVAWGWNDYGQATVPLGLTDVKQIAAGIAFTVVLKNDGAVIAWGSDFGGSIDVPPNLVGVTSLAAGYFTTFALIETPVSFLGGEVVGRSSTVVFTIKNAGIENLTLGPISRNGINEGDFAVSPLSVTMLAPGASTTVSVTFTPSALGMRTAMIRIPSNDSDADPFDLILAGTGLLSDDATLSDLAPSAGALSPEFASGTTSYSTTVPIAISSLTLTPTTNQSHAIVTVNGSPVASGTPSASVALKVGENTITTVVTAQNGTTVKTYTVTVTRTSPHLVIEQPAETRMNEGVVIAWGFNQNGQTAVPPGLTNVTAIAAGAFHTLALKSDGTVVAWGWNDYGQAIVPPDLSDVTAIAAGKEHSVALKSDGTVVVWGKRVSGQVIVPPDLTDVTAIAAGNYHTVALKRDGTVVAWGYIGFSLATVPEGLTGVAAIAAGYSYTLAVKTDGSIVSWGEDGFGQTIVLPGVSDVNAVSVGEKHAVALPDDGTVVAWGSNSQGQISVPPGLKDVMAIAAGGYHTVVLKRNGTVDAWGSNGQGQSTVPAGLNDVTSITAGTLHTVALIGTPVSAFGIQARNSTSIPNIFTIKNTGNENLILGAITKDGANSSEFTISTPASTTIPPGGSTTFTVAFSPSSIGERRAMIHIASNDTNYSPFELILSGIGVLPQLEAWRQSNFGINSNTRDAADLADPDQDDISNLLEYALGLNPNSRNLLPITTKREGELMKFTYTRSKEAFLAGLIFQVQSRDSLASGTWGTAGVSPETILNDNGSTQTVRVSVATSPASRFLRLSVTAP